MLRRSTVVAFAVSLAAAWLISRFLPTFLSGDARDLWSIGEHSSAHVSWVSGHSFLGTLAQAFVQSLGLGMLALGLALFFSAGVVLLSICFRFDAWLVPACLMFVGIPLPWWGPLAWRLASDSLSKHSIVVPSLILAATLSSFWILWFRREVLKSLQPHALSGVSQFSRAQGYPEWRIVWRDGFVPNLKNFFGHILYQGGHLLGGTWIIETVFNRPGLGTWMIESLHNRDVPVVSTTLFLILFVSLTCGFVSRCVRIP